MYYISDIAWNEGKNNEKFLIFAIGFSIFFVIFCVRNKSIFTIVGGWFTRTATMDYHIGMVDGILIFCAKFNGEEWPSWPAVYILYLLLNWTTLLNQCIFLFYLH